MLQGWGHLPLTNWSPNAMPVHMSVCAISGIKPVIKLQSCLDSHGLLFMYSEGPSPFACAPTSVSANIGHGLGRAVLPELLGVAGIQDRHQGVCCQGKVHFDGCLFY